MDVISMMHEVNFIANPAIGETALPHIALSANSCAQFVRVCALDQLNGPLDCHVHAGSQQKMHVLGHQDERM